MFQHTVVTKPNQYSTGLSLWPTDPSYSSPWCKRKKS